MPHDKRPQEFPFELTLRKIPGPNASVERSDEAFGYRAGHVIEDKYELVAILERGGMVVTWVAHNLTLDAQFALKLLGNDGGEHHAAERMLREARAAATIEHPALIRVFDFGVTVRGDPFIVTELLRGNTVKQLVVERRRLPPLEAVRLLLPIADALAVSHSHGVVHRNITADNIVCVQDDAGRVQPKIVDFGIGKGLERDWERIQRRGGVTGSAEYRSPEQVRGDSTIDQQTDIWSFSVVLYELLTGRTPFRRDDISAIVPAILHDPVLPLGLVGVSEDELSVLVLRGLHKLPETRWVDMRAYGRALAQWLVDHGVEDDVTAQSLRAVWLGGSPSAPPVAIDNFPERRAPAIANERFAGFNDAFHVPKRGIFRTGAGGAAATIALSGVVIAGLFVSGVFDETPPSLARAQSDAPPADALRPPASVPQLAAPGVRLGDEPVEDSEDPLADASDMGAVADAGASDAALDGARRAQASRAWRRVRGAGPPAWSPPPWQIAPVDAETVLPNVEPPPDLGPATVPTGTDGNEADDVPERDLGNPYDDPSDE